MSLNDILADGYAHRIEIRGVEMLHDPPLVRAGHEPEAPLLLHRIGKRLGVDVGVIF